METYLEYNLKLQLEIIKEQRDTYKSELEVTREALASYKILVQNQQAQICRLLDDKHFNRPLIKMSAV